MEAIPNHSYLSTGFIHEVSVFFWQGSAMMVGPMMGGMAPVGLAMAPQQQAVPGGGGGMMAMPNVYGVPNMYNMQTVSPL